MWTEAPPIRKKRKTVANRKRRRKACFRGPMSCLFDLHVQLSATTLTGLLLVTAPPCAFVFEFFYVEDSTLIFRECDGKPRRGFVRHRGSKIANEDWGCCLPPSNALESFRRLNFLPSTHLTCAGCFIKPTLRNKLPSESISLWTMVAGQVGFASPVTNVHLNGAHSLGWSWYLLPYTVWDWARRGGLSDIMVWKPQTLTEVVVFSEYCIALLYRTELFSECAGFFDDINFTKQILSDESIAFWFMVVFRWGLQSLWLKFNQWILHNWEIKGLASHITF